MESFHESRKVKPGHKYGVMQQFDQMAPWQVELAKHYAKHPYVHLPSTANQGVYQGGLNYLSSLMNQSPEEMQQFSAPYMREFREETMPDIMEAFRGMGANRGSGFEKALADAGASLQERLASLHGGLGMQAAQMALPYSQVPFEEAYQQQALSSQRGAMALGSQPFGYEYIEPRKKQQGVWGQVGSGFARGFGQNAGERTSKFLFGGG